MKYLIFALIPFYCFSQNIDLSEYQKFSISKVHSNVTKFKLENQTYIVPKGVDIHVDFDLVDEQGNNIGDYNFTGPEYRTFSGYSKIEINNINSYFRSTTNCVMELNVLEKDKRLSRYKFEYSDFIKEVKGLRTKMDDKLFLESNPCVLILANIQFLYNSLGDTSLWERLMKRKLVGDNKTINFYFLRGDRNKGLLMNDHFYFEFPESYDQGDLCEDTYLRKIIIP
jgi:hypothetical protein